MWTRRRVLKVLGGTAGMLSAALPLRPALPFSDPDVIVRLTAAPDEVTIRSGPKTAVLRFTGEVLRGRRDAVQSGSTYLGPTLDLRRGEHVRIEFRNRTRDASIIHWHGMIVPEVADGHPRFAVPPGSSYVYDFIVRNPAGTYLYHPHPHGATGAQVYHGLAGLLIVREPEERAYGLPASEHELPLVIQDRRFDGDNRLVYKRTMMDEMNGVLGDTVVVNGVADAAFRVAPRPYRLRLANVSNARIYKLAWSDGRPMRVIAADSGLFSAGEGIQTRPYVVLSPFERVELLENFSARRSGAEIGLVSQRFDAGAGMMGMMGRMMGGMMGAGQGEELLVARFTVGEGRAEPDTPLLLPRVEAPVAGGKHELHTELAFRHMRGFLNGRQFAMSAVADDERLPVGERTLWTFANDGPGMAMPHPMHVHGVRFRIVERRAGDAPSGLRDGLIDVGFKDTFSIFPGERVRLLVEPTEPGLFMYHCHNLEHEDGGMMRNCRFDA